MASVQDLIAAHEYQYGRPSIKNTLADSIIGMIGERQAAKDEQQKAQRDQQMAMDLLQKKFELEQQQEIEKRNRIAQENEIQNRMFEQEIEKRNRITKEDERQNNISEQLQGMDDRTIAGDVIRIIEGGKGTEIQRKISSPIKTSAKRVIKDGVVSTEITQEIGGDSNKEQMAIDKQLFDMAGKLRDDFRKSQVFKDFQEVRRAGTNIASAYERSVSANVKDRLASDQALVISFNKMLDPGSVVRESEYARTPEGQAAIQNYMGRITQLFKGGVGLTDQGRQEIKMMADELLRNAGSSAQKEADIYGLMADRFSIPRDMIFSEEEFKFDSLPLPDRSVGSGSVDVRIDSINTPSRATIGRFQVEVQ